MNKRLEDMYVDPWSPGFDDRSWDNVIIPHDWAVSFPFSTEWSSGTGYLPGGTGWYRTKFRLPEQWDGKKAYLCFDGVYKNSRVWCNGSYLGNRPSGYTGFRYDISHCLRQGKNVIAVKVSHEDFADSRWYTGSGIYRKAYITFYDRLFIDEQSVAVQTEYRNEEALVRVTGKILGNYGEAKSIALKATLKDKNKNRYISEMNIDPAATQKQLDDGFIPFDISVKVEKPALWSVDTPNLYNLRLILREKGNDKTISMTPPIRIGIRTIKFDPDKGFFLNGKPLKIKGVCVHHDAGCLGAAVWPEVWRRRLEKLKGCGCNAIRTSHNPQMIELYDLCDEMGFLVMDEAFDEWEGCKNKWDHGHNVYPPVHQGYALDFPEWHERDLADMVIRDRNHPSVIAWSIGNEIDYPNDPYAHPLFAEMTGNNDANKPEVERVYNPKKPNMERLSQIAPELVKIIKKHDTSRPVLLAAAFPELSSRFGLFNALDIVGYNYKEQFYEEDHKRFPALPILGSENKHSVAAWNAVKDNDYISGQFLWTGIDYLGEARGWPVRGSGAGLLDIAGNEKTAYFRRKALWSDKPFVYLTSGPKYDLITGDDEIPPRELFRSWDYFPGELVDVVCYTNLPSLELFCNEKSCGTAKTREDYCYASWRIPFERGTLKVKSAAQDTEISDSLESTFPPVRLNLREWKSSNPELSTNPTGKYRIAQVEVEMLDEQGRLCPASDMVNVFLGMGSGKILGLENGDLSDCTEYSTTRRRLYRGRLIIYILLAEEATPLLLAVAEGLEGASLKLKGEV
jgi:hypothetical protein